MTLPSKMQQLADRIYPVTLIVLVILTPILGRKIWKRAK